MAKRKSTPTAQRAIRIGRANAEAILAIRAEAKRTRARALRARARERGLSSAAASLESVAAVATGTVVAEGDSWFDYPFNDVLKILEDEHGYDVEHDAHRGDTVEQMAYTRQLADFSRVVEKVLRRGVVPKAILLSGGGNDIAGDEFAILLNHVNSPEPGLNPSILRGVIDERGRSAYITILSTITALCQQQAGQTIPIVLHGYDYPVPDGRGYMGGAWFLPGPWLDPGFRIKGYPREPQASMRRRMAILVDLIDRFNAMLQSVVAMPQFRHVHFVDLRRTLSTGANYRAWWDNELHPTKRGFRAVTVKFAQKLAGL